MRQFLISCFPALLLLAPAGAAQAVPSRVRVVNAEKGWVMEGSPVERGDRLSSDKLLSTQDSGDLTLDCGTPGWLSYSCRTGHCSVRPCDKGAGLEVRRVDLGAAGFLLVAGDHISALFEREPKTPVMAVTRSTGSPSDALLLQNSQGLHLGGTLARVLEGQYCVRLARLPTKTAAMPRVISLNWDRAVDAEGIARTASLTPGTYLLQLGTPGGVAKTSACMPEPEAVPAWVVIAPESRFARANADWNDKQARLDTLERSGASAALVATLRHAVLSSISESVEAP
jgi:hypothetical protein